MEKKSKLILSIDDDPSFNKLLSKTFSKTDYDVITTETVDEFINAYMAHHPDLCLVDINLAEKIGAGYKLLSLIRLKIDKKVPLIVISKVASEYDISHALSLGASDFLSKPLDLTSLVKKVDLFLGDSFFTSDFPLLPIPGKYKDCTYTLDLQICRIDEFSITFQSPHHITTGTQFQIEGTVLKEITGKDKLTLYVLKTSKIHENNCFEIHAELSDEDRELSNNIRKWLGYQKNSEA